MEWHCRGASAAVIAENDQPPRIIYDIYKWTNTNKWGIIKNPSTYFLKRPWYYDFYSTFLNSDVSMPYIPVGNYGFWTRGSSNTLLILFIDIMRHFVNIAYRDEKRQRIIYDCRYFFIACHISVPAMSHCSEMKEKKMRGPIKKEPIWPFLFDCQCLFQNIHNYFLKWKSVLEH